MRKMRSASSHYEVVLHDLMLVTMRVLNCYNLTCFFRTVGW